MSLEGRMYPVEIAYSSQPTLNYVDTAVQAVFDIHLNVSTRVIPHWNFISDTLYLFSQQPPGDILVFLTGRDEIETALELVAERLPK